MGLILAPKWASFWRLEIASRGDFGGSKKEPKSGRQWPIFWCHFPILKIASKSPHEAIGSQIQSPFEAIEIEIQSPFQAILERQNEAHFRRRNEAHIRAFFGTHLPGELQLVFANAARIVEAFSMM